MKLYYCTLDCGNFGDDLNPWLWPQVAPGLLDDDPDVQFVGIGTILNRRMPAGVQRVVFSTGYGYGRPPRLTEAWHVYCVRGPLTAQALGLPPAAAITDGAALIRTLDLPPAERTPGRIGYMPHFSSTLTADWRRVCDAAGLAFIDPCGRVPDVLNAIRQCECILAEAMHGAIVADALRIPWIAVRSHSSILDFKWRDWCASLNLVYRPVTLPMLHEQPLSPSKLARNFLKRACRSIGLGKAKWDRLPLRVDDGSVARQIAAELRRIADREHACLSADDILDQQVDRLQNTLRRLCADWKKPQHRRAA